MCPRSSRCVSRLKGRGSADIICGSSKRNIAIDRSKNQPLTQSHDEALFSTTSKAKFPITMPNFLCGLD